MTKFSHLIIIIIFAPIYLFSETITIYATQSAQYSADDCCTLNILTNQNSNSLHSQDCQDMGAYYGCGMSKQVPFWVFDLSTVENNIDIQSIQFKGNLPSESWSDVYLSISTEVGQISTTIASDLWNGGDWASGSGQYSSINWPMGDFSQDLPLEVISQGIISGQLNILTYTSSPWSIFSIANSGDNAPRIVIDYDAINLSMDKDILPLQYALHQNYPNPFNPTTTLQYNLPNDEFVNITIYDMLGNVINNLVHGNQNSGYKSVLWNATNNQGQPVSAGVYLYSIETGDFRQTKKMIFLK